MTVELIEATKKANIPNACFLSSAGCDLAERDKQPLLCEFFDMETMFMSSKGGPLDLYWPFPGRRAAQEEGTLPLPVGTNHKFAPIALGDVAHVVAHVLTGQGKHGFSDQHRGQLMVLTGPMLATGDELAAAASKLICS
ncbi:hypothetical protein ASPSYDRAFT_137945 [Aspergillus sydowii CBS 593.65]|uniref:Uncharacterized protein n=1 Tax=Aspergillus sydowii CBS 593.65 TaxID=1036612 RepID=A0A1L9SYK5_9EURO|nr:uncharacterized protein ASPSYDRAFT_137945 [Aspergillus sydowii CBS 593.65]OJJ52249.1 hypothetical protein ASPSYDRAFT_137945 [Aspergillus sydowii CBS 593.65]